MSNFNLLLSQILRGAYLIRDDYAKAHMPIIARLLKGEPAMFEGDIEKANKRKNTPFAFVKKNGKIEAVHNSLDIEPKSLAVITLSGPVMKHDNCGTPGTKTIMNYIKEADLNDNVGAILLVVDTGGGAVDGTFELADEIKKTSKPLVSFVDGMACSAGYALVSQAKEVYLSHKTAEVGSIGVCTTIYDWSEHLKNMGVQERYINASTSPDKNKEYLEAEKGNVSLFQKNFLDKIHKIFIDTVKAGRGEKIKDESVFKGGAWMGDEAIEKGLADGISSFEDVVIHCFDLMK
jgi:ClpP class serine protease